MGTLTWAERTAIANIERKLRGMPPISDTARYSVLDVAGDIVLVDGGTKTLEAIDRLAAANARTSSFSGCCAARCTGVCAGPSSGPR